MTMIVRIMFKINICLTREIIALSDDVIIIVNSIDLVSPWSFSFF